MAKHTGEGHMTGGGKYSEDCTPGEKAVQKGRYHGDNHPRSGKKLGSSVTGNPHKNTGEPTKGMSSY